VLLDVHQQRLDLCVKIGETLLDRTLAHDSTSNDISPTGPPRPFGYTRT
jgi:hypothetical protein